ncbi:hypothetical protein JXA47_01570 [Candidatus Sumerlaeota bacterium]|nr:hypothetical protein [Candidatus Sumerlaeota bacterium]
MSESERGKGLKLAVAAALCIGALVFVYLQWAGNRVTPPLEDEGPVMGGRGLVQPLSPEEMQQRRAEFLREINVTPEQVAQMMALGTFPGRDATPEARQAHFEAMREILTPEQRDRIRERVGERIRERLDRQLQVLPPDQRELFERMLEERMRERGGRWGEGPPLPPPPDGRGPPPFPELVGEMH